jgi:hypothetical protein
MSLCVWKVWNLTTNYLYPYNGGRRFLTCICLRRRLFRVTLDISQTVINLAYRDILTSQRGHWPLLTRTRYVCTCLGAGSGMGGGIRKIKAFRWGAYYYSLVLNAQPCKYDMYKSSLRHIHDPVLSSLKMKGIPFIFFEMLLQDCTPSHTSQKTVVTQAMCSAA